MTNAERLKGKILSAPQRPGCYLFKDRLGYVIYVGKSKTLRSRVRSYFHESADDKARELAAAVFDVEFFVTETEIDALLHEHRLIKEHRPAFNSQMNENAPHPMIKITDCRCGVETFALF